MAKASTPPQPPILTASGIQKRFGGVRALVDGSFELRAGEVHAIMGENGAGKSTLGKILAGVFAADAGTMTLDGNLFRPTNPRVSQALGVAMIFQELDLFPHLSVLENMVIANQAYAEGLLPSRSAMEAFASPHLESVGFMEDPTRLIGELSVGDQQLVAIARALSMKARILVMDESTSALTEDAVERLFGVVRRLRDLGVAIVYVSHKMDEIFGVCDRVTVLRDGSTVAQLTVAETNMDELIQHMVGREIDRSRRATSHATDRERLRFHGVSTDFLRDVNFTLNAGEVLGIAGLVGSGRTEIGRALFGLDRVRNGTIFVDGNPHTPRSVRAARRASVGLVPEDRKAMGLMMQMGVRENASLAILDRLSNGGLLRAGEEANRHENLSERTRLKSDSPFEAVSNLSGGNQQKVLLGRWLLADPGILFLDDPTRGVDVGAKEDIYALIETMAAEGKALLMVSSELPELLRCCDRILVMNQGQMVGEFDARSVTQEEIMELAAK